MRFGLRGRILLVTVLTPALLGVVTYLTVRRNVLEHVDASSIHESLTHSQAVFESILATRSRALGGGAQVIAQDPRFFSLLMLEGAQRDSRFQATVRGMARDFSRITDADLFEVFDARGRVLASAGTLQSTRGARDAFIRRALHGDVVEGVLVQNGAHCQVAVAPVRADARVVGVLLLGARIGDDLARQLRSQMRCEVTFLSDTSLTGTTLDHPTDRKALISTLAGLDLGPRSDLHALGVLQVQGASGTQLTIVRRIPGTNPALRQLYVLQRSFDPETIFRRRMENDLVWLAGAAVLAAILTGWLFSNQIIRPVRAIVQAAQAMEQGDYEHPLNVKRRDEVGYLATRFLEMRRRERGYVESLERAARVKSDFIRIASQEMRSPIGSLVSFRDLLAANQLGPTNERQAKALEAMRECLVRLSRLADDATNAGQLQGERLEPQLEPVPISRFLALAAGEAHAADPGHPVRVEGDRSLGEVTLALDPELLPNAIAQLIEFTMRGAPEGGEVHLLPRIEGTRLCLRVVEGKESAKNTPAVNVHPDTLGLGVSLARGVIQAHGGTLLAVPRAGRGTTFEVELPLGGEARAAA